MITALVLTVALGSNPPVEIDYAYANEMACESAKARAFYSTTGEYSVALDCRRGDLVSQPAPTDGKWKVLALGLRQNTTVPTMAPELITETADEASCDAMLDRLHPRLKAMAGRQFVSVCLPKA
jgi:hypothetical protein